MYTMFIEYIEDIEKGMQLSRLGLFNSKLLNYDKLESINNQNITNYYSFHISLLTKKPSIPLPYYIQINKHILKMIIKCIIKTKKC